MKLKSTVSAPYYCMDFKNVDELGGLFYICQKTGYNCGLSVHAFSGKAQFLCSCILHNSWGNDSKGLLLLHWRQEHSLEWSNS